VREIRWWRKRGSGWQGRRNGWTAEAGREAHGIGVSGGVGEEAAGNTRWWCEATVRWRW